MELVLLLDLEIFLASWADVSSKASFSLRTRVDVQCVKLKTVNKEHMAFSTTRLSFVVVLNIFLHNLLSVIHLCSFN